MSIDVNNNTSLSVSSKPYLPKGDIKTLVKIMRSQSSDFDTRDLVGELNTVSQKDTPCKRGSAKQPSIKFLTTVEKELKQANALVKGTTGIATEYAKLLHNKHHLNQAYQKIQSETILASLRESNNPLDNDSPTLSNQTSFPMGKITSVPEVSPQAAPVKVDVQKPDATYNLAPAPDIFSTAKNGNPTTYKIVPFDFIAGS